MSVEQLRNVTTGEIRDVETASEEYLGMINEVYDHDGAARPKWEITGIHHTQRLDNSDVGEPDMGYKYKPVPGAEVDVSEVGPELNPHHALTEAEVESGITSWKQKEKELGLVVEDTTRGAEPLERVDPEDRLSEGMDAAGSTSKKSKASATTKNAGTGAQSSAATKSGGSNA